MKKKPGDLIIEAAHFKSDGQLDYVRAYQRRGATFSDILLITRNELLAYLLGGKVVLTGKREHLMGSTFSNITRVKTVMLSNRIFISTSGRVIPRDELTEVPIL